MNRVLFSSKTDQWATPLDFFNELDAEFHFDLDPCADELNHKCKRYFTKEQNGLLQNWGGVGFSAIHHTEKKLLSGLRNLIEKQLKKIRW